MNHIEHCDVIGENHSRLLCIGDSELAVNAACCWRELAERRETNRAGIMSYEQDPESSGSSSKRTASCCC
jgi:hypothetical protein